MQNLESDKTLHKIKRIYLNSKKYLNVFDISLIRQPFISDRRQARQIMEDFYETKE